MFSLFQAVKYLERMLIQAQNQSSSYNELKSFHTPVVADDNDMDVDSNDEKKSISVDKKVNSMDDDSNNYSSDDINIDPRTYCKLGHFHLLLEDYPKGIVFRK